MVLRMNRQANNTNLTPNSTINTDKIEWVCVSWFNKTSNAVANKTCRFLGIAVAALAAVFTFIPSLAVDLGYAIKRLYDRKINTPPTPIQNFMPSNDSEHAALPDPSTLGTTHLSYVIPDSSDLGSTYHSVESQYSSGLSYKSCSSSSMIGHTSLGATETTRSSATNQSVLPETASASFIVGGSGSAKNTLADQIIESKQVESCKQHVIEETMLDSGVLELSPQEAARHFLNTIDNLAKKHNLSIERVIDCEKIKTRGNLYFKDDPITTKQNVKEIFVDFILFMEGMLKDQQFNFSDDVDKYCHKKTITNKRVNEIDKLLSEIFTQQEISPSKKGFFDTPYYSLRELLSDYLLKNYTDSADRRYKMIGREVFGFFEEILFGNGFFSEFVHSMRFIDSHKQELIEAFGKFRFIDNKCRNLITSILRSNKKLRMDFNQSVMEPEFNKHWPETLNDMFVEKPDSAGPVTALDHYVNLKFGEELEYNFNSEKCGGMTSCVWEFEEHMQKLGANKISSSGLTFDGHFHVIPFIDSYKWFEMNCTPYHDGEAGAENCLKKVFESVDEMISLGYINQSSGHKHVDALSATRGNPAVLLELQREIESNPYLIRAFGNNDKIVKDDESQWYKLFSDYSDMKELAIKRMNSMITSYNEKSAESNHDEVNSYWLTDSEKLDKLKQFSEIYSNYVQMSILQQIYGNVGDVFTNKFMAIGLLHIPGTVAVDPYSTIEFRFFRCPENMEELKLINQFLTAWFEYIHNRRIKGEPIQCVPDDVKASKDYTAEEVRDHTAQYLQKLGLNPDDYHSFLNKVSEEMPET